MAVSKQKSGLKFEVSQHFITFQISFITSQRVHKKVNSAPSPSSPGSKARAGDVGGACGLGITVGKAVALAIGKKAIVVDLHGLEVILYMSYLKNLRNFGSICLYSPPLNSQDTYCTLRQNGVHGRSVANVKSLHDWRTWRSRATARPNPPPHHFSNAITPNVSTPFRLTSKANHASHVCH